jgi:predicted transcriptional regulator
MVHARLSGRERQVMDVLYRLGSASATDVRDALPDAPGYSAVRAVLRVLERKGLLVHRPEGPRYVYAPRPARSDARRSELRRLLDTFFDGSAEEVVEALLDPSVASLTPGQLERLGRLVEEAAGRGGDSERRDGAGDSRERRHGDESVARAASDRESRPRAGASAALLAAALVASFVHGVAVAEPPRAPRGQIQPYGPAAGAAPLAGAAGAAGLAAGDTTQAPADTTRTAGDPSVPKRIPTARIADSPPDVDGRLDDAAWAGAAFDASFLQKEPNQGAPPVERTEVAFLFDDHALYVAARMESRDPGALDDVITARDDHGNAERIVVTLDTFHDRRTAYAFGVTASGVRLDWFHPDDDETRTDLTFNPVWVARTARDPRGWTAEMRIPFSQLRFRRADPQVWGVNVHRVVPARNESDYWVHVPRDQSGWASRFGELVGIQGVPATRRLEVTPYVSSDTRTRSDALVDSENPLDDGSSTGFRSGVDVKMGLGPNLTLDAALNPDFGQVEADPAQVNLSASEIFFDERRPFFTEGSRPLGAHLYSEFTTSDPPPLFYTRRIGAPPHGTAAADFVTAPQVSTILGAAKLSGRLDSGLSIGALAAVTDAEHAETFDVEMRQRDLVRVEPRTGFGVVRLEQELGRSGSTAALFATGVRRALGEDDPLAALLVEQAYAGGADWNLRFGGGNYDLKGHLLGSWLQGDSLAIARVQRSSVHYFQRPDTPQVDFDPGRTSLAGASAMLRFRKTGGGHWRGEAGIWGDGPGFEINDLGRIGKADDIALWGNLRWREDDPAGALRNWEVGLFGSSNLNFGGVRKFSRAALRGRTTWSNFWSNVLEVGYVPPYTSDDATRGGPLMTWAPGWDLYWELLGNQQARSRWGTTGFFFRNGLGGWSLELDGTFATQAGDRWKVSVEPRFTLGNTARQYLATLEGGRPETFGSRYVFAHTKRGEVATPVRVNYALSPDLGLELYAEPFASSGTYRRFGELGEAGGRDLRTYGEAPGTTLSRGEDGSVVVTDGDGGFTLPDPDFHVVSFRSNLLLRWEWHPGSTVYLVWQQNRSGSEPGGRLVSPGSLLDSFTADGENVFALKVTYWLPIG